MQTGGNGLKIETRHSGLQNIVNTQANPFVIQASYFPFSFYFPRCVFWQLTVNKVKAISVNISPECLAFAKIEK